MGAEDGKGSEDGSGFKVSNASRGIPSLYPSLEEIHLHAGPGKLFGCSGAPWSLSPSSPAECD